jgi:hypothetical protein
MIAVRSKEMPDGSTRFCGTLCNAGPEGDQEFDCILEPGHDGFCEFPPEADTA